MNNALVKFCESKGVINLQYVSEDKAREYYSGFCPAINKKISVMYAYFQFGTVWFDGVISGMAR
ncbi:hypothetical protein ABES02_29060 [Neobacillus pocheonensis]|uniref:hypothetical protein n=1 Tax=Neobacillus pocheonensis TaxID=363869 RepID=UPI003D2A4B8B